MPPQRRAPRDASDAKRLEKRRRWYDRHKHEVRPVENEKKCRIRAHHRKRHEHESQVVRQSGFDTIVNANALRNPPLYFIDATGHVHKEDSRSAAQLIRAWEKSQKKKGVPHER